MSADALTAQTGFYGKLPTRGDFVARGLARSFIEPLDAWLQQAIIQSQRLLGEAWLDKYLKCPFWRYALSPGVCGEMAHLGVLMSSVDNVGRYFPLTIASALRDDMLLLELVELSDAWFERAEAIAFDGLDGEMDLDQFAEAVHGLTLPEISEPGLVSGEIEGTKVGTFRYAEPGFVKAAWRRAYGLNLKARGCRLGFWWTTGSAGLPPSLFYCDGMPDPAAYAAMVDGTGMSVK